MLDQIAKIKFKALTVTSHNLLFYERNQTALFCNLTLVIFFTNGSDLLLTKFCLSFGTNFCTYMMLFYIFFIIGHWVCLKACFHYFYKKNVHLSYTERSTLKEYSWQLFCPRFVSPLMSYHELCAFSKLIALKN